MLKKKRNSGQIMMFLIMLAAVTLTPDSNAFSDSVLTKQTTYSTVTEICDWGAVAKKVVVNLGKPVRQGSITKDTFEVFISRSDPRLKEPFLNEGFRTITKAYVSDKKGNPTVMGSYAALEMEIGPNKPLCSLINYNIDTQENAWVDYQYTITQVRDIGVGPCRIFGLVAKKRTDEIKTLVDDFSIGMSKEYGQITFPYAEYQPAKDRKKNPLIIWLHGGGEGGTDVTLPLAANKSVNFISKEIQSYFGGAYVLVPQSRTYWAEGKTLPFDGTSVYEEALMEFIKDYVSQNNDIDINRIYIGGCSCGGYMTMLMIRNHPEYFAAAFPVCECLYNEVMYEGQRYTLVTDEHIRQMKDVPIWFVASKNDPSTPSAECSTKTYERLIQAGARNVYYSLFDDVHDTSGLYLNADGTPFQYHGHYSWIYLFNNECQTTVHGKTTTIMEWLASMSLKNR